MREPRCRIGYGHPANSHQKSARKWPGCGLVGFLYYYSLHDNVAEGCVMSCHVSSRKVFSYHIMQIICNVFLHHVAPCPPCCKPMYCDDFLLSVLWFIRSCYFLDGMASPNTPLDTIACGILPVGQGKLKPLTQFSAQGEKTGWDLVCSMEKPCCPTCVFGALMPGIRW